MHPRIRIWTLLAALIASVLWATPSSAATASNPWGYVDGQVLTTSQAEDVVLFELNQARSDYGLAALPRSSDTAGVQCALNSILNSGQFGHNAACMSPGRGEILYSRRSSLEISKVEAADGWHDSPSHNRVLYATTGDEAAIALRCVPNGASGNRALAAVQVIALQGSIGANYIEGPNSTERHPERATEGVGCRDGKFIFRTAVEVTETAAPTEEPQYWHRYSVARLYAAYFSRYPDDDGWAYWNRQILNGADLHTLSSAFSDSDEFRQTYGDAVDDRAFLRIVYQQVLGRLPDAAGISYWEKRMAAGMTRGEIMVYFSESDEFVIRSGPAITGDCWNGDVEHSYSCAAPNTVAPA